MLLVDAVYINDGGGKVLLDLLIEKLLREKQEIFYLLDERVKGQYPNLDTGMSLYIKNSFRKRLNFYKMSGNKFSKVLTFGNVPPPVKLDAEVFTYFHNVLYLNPIIGFTLYNLLLRIKICIIGTLSRNTLIWFVQSNVMKEKLANRFKIDLKKILVFPIFQDFMPVERVRSLPPPKIIKYLYVSDGHPYKNHHNLIKAFVYYAKKSGGDNSLTLTISSRYAILCSFIENLRNEGINIINRGIIGKEALAAEYQNADVAVYPSFSESFGLGLVEAAQYGLPVIAADLSYIHEVIEPSIVFDPRSVDDIYRALVESKKYIGKPVKLKAKNGLNDMINIIINNNGSNV